MGQDTKKAKFTIYSDQNEWENQSKTISENEISVNSQIWCVDCNENVVVLGCADGSLQFWDLYEGIRKVWHWTLNYNRLIYFMCNLLVYMERRY